MNIIQSLSAKKLPFLEFRLMSFIRTLIYYFNNPEEVSANHLVTLLVELVPDDKDQIEKLIDKINAASATSAEGKHALTTVEAALTGKLEILSGQADSLEQYILSLEKVEDLLKDHKTILQLNEAKVIATKIKNVHNNNLYIETTMLEAKLLDRLNASNCSAAERKVSVNVISSIRKYKENSINSEILIDDIKAEYANANRNIFTTVAGFFGKLPHLAAYHLWEYLEVIRALQAVEMLSPRRNHQESPFRTL